MTFFSFSASIRYFRKSIRFFSVPSSIPGTPSFTFFPGLSPACASGNASETVILFHSYEAHKQVCHTLPRNIHPACLYKTPFLRYPASLSAGYYNLYWDIHHNPSVAFGWSSICISQLSLWYLSARSLAVCWISFSTKATAVPEPFALRSGYPPSVAFRLGYALPAVPVFQKENGSPLFSPESNPKYR